MYFPIFIGKIGQLKRFKEWSANDILVENMECYYYLHTNPHVYTFVTLQYLPQTYKSL